jgi:hypothetical protein
MLLDWPMRYDESYTYIHYARYALSLGLTTYDAPNNHLLHTFLVHIAYRLFGDAPWALRLPAFVAGVLTLPVGYLVGRCFVGSAAALLATSAMATAMVMIEMSTNARGYSIVGLVFLLLLGLAQYLRRRDNAAGWVLFAALGALGTYAIPTMVYGFATAALWLFLSALTGDIAVERPRFLRRLAAAVVGCGIATAALYATILLRGSVATILASPTVATKVHRLPWDAFLAGNLDKMGDTWRRWTADWPVALRATAAAGALVAIGRHARVISGRVPVWLSFLGAAVPMLLVQRVVPFSRVWGFLFPWFCIMAAGGIVHLLGCIPRLGRVGLERTVVVLALLLLAWQTTTLPRRAQQYPYTVSSFPDAESVARYLAPRLEPGDRILLVGTFMVPFWYYCERYGIPYVGTVFDTVRPEWFEVKRRVFVIVNEQGPPANEVSQTLEGVLTRAQATGFGPATPLVRNEKSAVYLIAGGPSERAPAVAGRRRDG